MRNKTKNTLIVVAFALVFVLLIGVFAKFNSMETTKNLGTTSFAIGSINDTGGVIESEQNIYLKEMQSTKGLTIKLEKDATISYKVFYYDKDGKFDSKSESLKADLDSETIPETAVYFRVLITPAEVDSKPVTVTILNMSKYVDQLKITISK